MLRKRIWWIIAGILLIFLIRQVDIDELHHSLSQIHWPVVVWLLLLQVLSQLLLNMQWYRIAKFASLDIPFWRMLYINSQGSVMESITPGVKVGGEVTRAVQISRMSDCSGQQAAVVVALQKTFSLSAFALVNIGAVMHLSQTSPWFTSKFIQLIIYAVLGAVLVCFILVFLRPRQFLQRLSAKKAPQVKGLAVIRRFLQNLLEHILLFEKNRRELIGQIILALIIWALYPVKLYLLVSQIHNDIPFIYLSSITFISYMVGMLPLFPGGLGGFEGTMTGLLSSLGIPLGSATVLSVVFRFITFWFVILGSLAYLVVYPVVYYKSSIQKEC